MLGSPCSTGISTISSAAVEDRPPAWVKTSRIVSEGLSSKTKPWMIDRPDHRDFTIMILVDVNRQPADCT